MIGDMLAFLESGSDFRCPSCFSSFDVKWDTEYGNPMDGDYNFNCPECNRPIPLEVRTTTDYRVKFNGEEKNCGS